MDGEKTGERKMRRGGGRCKEQSTKGEGGEGYSKGKRKSDRRGEEEEERRKGVGDVDVDVDYWMCGFWGSFFLWFFCPPVCLFALDLQPPIIIIIICLGVRSG